MPIIKVIIPAFNEADSIVNVINDIPNIVDEVIVVSNNSTDATETNAKQAGATVLTEPQKGYGYASKPHLLVEVFLAGSSDEDWH